MKIIRHIVRRLKDPDELTIGIPGIASAKYGRKKYEEATKSTPADDDAEEEDEYYCDSCGAEVLETDNYCPSCGEELEGSNSLFGEK